MNTCDTCKFRTDDGHCTSEKVQEDWGQSAAERVDSLVYSYNESGRFWVGPKFGCVHHEGLIL
jgi:hypothetical protein